MKVNQQNIIIAIFSGVLLSSPVLATTSIIYVNNSSGGSNDGSNWANAYNSSTTALQDALDDAASQLGSGSPPDIVEIWVAEGTYKPSTKSDATKSRSETFQMIDKVHLYGGFVNSCTTYPHSSRCNQLTDRRYACKGGDNAGRPCETSDDCPGSICGAYSTVLSGDISTTDGMFCASDASCGTGNKCVGGECIKGDNAFHVVTYSTPNADVKIDGFIIKYGRADGSGVDNQGGGIMIREPLRCNGGSNDGVLCEVAADCPGASSGDECVSDLCLSGDACTTPADGMTINNCLILRNYSLKHGAVNDHASGTAYDNCVFSNNRAATGAGLQVDNGEPCISASLFTENTTDAIPDEGAGIWLGGRVDDITCTTECPYAAACPISPSPTITNCVFENNIARLMGGGLFSENSFPIISDCTFNSNAATGSPAPKGGGACWFESDLDVTNNTLVSISGCTFNGNYTTSFYSFGGAIYVLNVDAMRIEDSAFLGNSVDSGGGAGLFEFNSDITHVNSVFTGNTASYQNSSYGGAAVWIWGSIADFVNCSIVDNVAAGESGGVFVDHLGSITLSNCILWANESVTGTTEEQQLAIGPNVIIYENGIPVSSVPGGTITITSSTIDGLVASGSYDDGTNIDADPSFVSDPYDGGDGWGVGSNDDYGDLNLGNCSPAVDAGDNSKLPADTFDQDSDSNVSETLPYDLESVARQYDDTGVTDSGSGTSPIVDMGAYEKDTNSSSCP